MKKHNNLFEQVAVTVVAAEPPDRIPHVVMQHLGQHAIQVNNLVRATGNHIYVFHAGLDYVLSSVDGGGLVAWVGSGGNNPDRPGGAADLGPLLARLGFHSTVAQRASTGWNVQAQVSALLVRVGTALHVAGTGAEAGEIEVEDAGICVWNADAMRTYALVIDRHARIAGRA